MTPPQKNLIFPFLLVLYEITNYLSNDMYLPALPQMMRDLGLTTQQAQLTLTAWFLGQASMPLIAGAVSDRFGRRPVLLLGGIIYVLATIACAITLNGPLLLIARFIEGSMVPAMLVAGYACIHELYEQKEAVRILALMSSISVLAPALGPLAGSIELYFSTWRIIFWTIALSALIMLLLLYKWMPETLSPEERHPLQLGLLFKKYSKILTNIKFMLLLFVLGCIFGGFIVWITASPLLIIQTFHYSAITFGVMQAAVFAVYILGNRWVKYLIEKLSIIQLIRLGLFITLCGGLLMFVFAICFPQAIYAFLSAMMIYSFGSALCFSPLNRMIIESSDEPMGIRVALFTIGITGFAALGSAMASVMFDGHIASIAYPIAAAIVFACLIKGVANRFL